MISAPSRPVRIVFRNRSRSVRDRSVSATGTMPGGLELIARHERARERQEVFVADLHRRDVGGAHHARQLRARALGQRRGENPAVGAERDLAAGQPLDLFGESIVEEESDGQASEHVGRISAKHDRHAHHLQHAARVGDERRDLVERFRILQGVRERELRGARSGRAQQHAAASGQQQQVGVHRVAVFVGERLHGRRIAGFNRGLQLRRAVGDEPRQPRERVGQPHAVLIDEDPRLVQPAPELRLRLARRARVDEIEREAERQHRQQGAGEEDPIRERRGNRQGSIIRIS